MREALSCTFHVAHPVPLHLRAELLLGQRCDTKVDLYSLGVPLPQCLAAYRQKCMDV